MTPVPHVKICCIQSVEEARTAFAYGASAVGLVGPMPSGFGPITEEQIAEIAATVPPPVATFLLTCSQDVEAIIAQQRRCGCNTLQLCDRLTKGSHADLRTALPGIRVVQVIHVTGEASLDEALEAAESADALLLDSGNPSLAVKELGGTGRRHDWRISREICERSRVPVFLAGGLTPENIREAIETVGPFGVDVCTGVRTDGCLDEERLRAFMSRIHESAGVPGRSRWVTS